MAEKRFSAIFVCLKPDMAVLGRGCIAAGKGRWYAGFIKEEWIMKDGKWVPWRVIAAIIGVLAIAYLWATKDVELRSLASAIAAACHLFRRCRSALWVDRWCTP